MPRTLTPSEEMRLFVGFIVQPFVAALAAYVCAPPLFDNPHSLGVAGSMAGGVLIYAFFITIVGVVPLAIWILKRRALSFVEALLFGMGFGLPGLAIVGEPWRGLLFGSTIGMICAAAFWLISIRGHDFSRNPRNEPGERAGPTSR